MCVLASKPLRGPKRGTSQTCIVQVLHVALPRAEVPRAVVTVVGVRDVVHQHRHLGPVNVALELGPKDVGACVVDVLAARCVAKKAKGIFFLTPVPMNAWLGA